MGTIYAQDFGPTRVKWRTSEWAMLHPWPQSENSNVRVQKWMHLGCSCRIPERADRSTKVSQSFGLVSSMFQGLWSNPHSCWYVVADTEPRKWQ
jgi:hypothetical protein